MRMNRQKADIGYSALLGFHARGIQARAILAVFPVTAAFSVICEILQDILNRGF